MIGDKNNKNVNWLKTLFGNLAIWVTLYGIEWVLLKNESNSAGPKD